MPDADNEVAAFLEQLQGIFTADGASLNIHEAGVDHIRLSVDFSDEACRECVMPPDMITELIENNLKSVLREGAEITVEWND
jgi:hypothetical protein